MTRPPTDLFARQLVDAANVLNKIDEKGRDLNQLRWDAAKKLAGLHAAGLSIDELAEKLNRKPADIRHYITSWKAYGDDEKVRSEQSFGGLSRLVGRFPNDPKARQDVIDRARAQGRSVSTVMDHDSYRGSGGGIKGGRGKGGGGREVDPLIKQLLAAGAPLAVEQMWYALDTALHYANQIAEDDAALPQAVTAMVAGRMDRLRSIWSQVETNAELAAMAKGE